MFVQRRFEIGFDLCQSARINSQLSLFTGGGAEKNAKSFSQLGPLLTEKQLPNIIVAHVFIYLL